MSKKPYYNRARYGVRKRPEKKGNEVTRLAMTLRKYGCIMTTAAMAERLGCESAGIRHALTLAGYADVIDDDGRWYEQS